MIELSPKAIRFLIEALNQYQEQCDRRLEEPGVSEDELADLANDRQYLMALREDLQVHHDELLNHKESVQTKV